MAPEAGHDDGEANQNTVFIDTSLDTHLATLVSDSDTVSDLKKKITLEHRQCFPAIGDIKIHCLKVKRRGIFYHMSDSLLVKSAFGGTKKNWFVSVDASRLEQIDEIQHMGKPNAGNQLALPWVTDSRSIDRYDSHADKPSKLSLVHGSPSMHPKIVPFFNQRVSSVDQFTSGESCKDVSKNMVEGRSSNDNHWRNLKPDSEKLDLEVHEKCDTVNKEIKSKKRVRNVLNEGSLEDALESGPSVKKKRTSQKIELEGTVKASEGDIVLPQDTDKIKGKGASINDQNSVEHKSESKNVSLDGVATEPLSDEHARTMSVSQKKKKKKKINRMNKGHENSSHDQLATAVPSGVGDVEETLPQRNTEANEIVPDVVVVVEKNIQQETSVGMSQKENCNELVQNALIGDEIPSSSLRTSDGERDAPEVTTVGHLKGAKRSTKHKAAEKEVSSTPFIKKLHNVSKDAIDSSQQELGSTGKEFAGDQIDKGEEDGAFSLNQGPEVKLPERSKRKKAKKTAAKNKDELLVKHAGDISSSVPNPVFDDKIIDERKNDEDNLSHAERNEVSEKKLIDDSLVSASKKSDDLIVKEVETSEPTENNKSQVHAEDVEGKSGKEFKDTMGSKRKKKDVARFASRNNESVVKQANNAATETNEGTLLPHFERKENIEMTSNNDNLMDYEVEISRMETNKSQVNAEDINDKMDSTKKNKKKRKTKKSAARNEDESITKHANDPCLSDHLHENVKSKSSLPDADEKDIPKEKLADNKDIEQHPLPEETSKNVKESKTDNIDNQVDIPKDGSHEIDFKHYFVPDQQQNEIASVKEKKPKKKTKELLLLVETSRNDGAILSQKSLSKNENNKVLVSINGVKDSNFSNVDQIKTPKKTRKIDAPRVSKSAHASKRDDGPSSESSSRSLGQTHSRTSKKSAPVMNNSQNVKSLLNKPGAIFGDDSDESSADDNANVDSDSSTRTPSAKSSSSGESDSSIDSKRNGSYATKRKEGGGNNDIDSQSRLKNVSMADLLRSSSRFKKAKLTASKQMGDTESQPVDFVPESQPTAKR